MPPKRSSPKPSVRRASAHATEMEVTKKAKEEAQQQAEEEAAATEAEKKAARGKSAAGTKKDIASTTPVKRVSKRKSPAQETPKSDDTHVGDEPGERSSKKSKSSDESDEQSTPARPRGRKPLPQITTPRKTALKKGETAAPAPVDIDYVRITTDVAQALDSTIARQLRQTVHAALLPCLHLIHPLMAHTLACSGLRGDEELPARIATTAVVDAVERLKADWDEALESPVSPGLPDEVLDDGFEA